MLYDFTPRYVDPTVEMTQEVTDEFLASLKLIIFKHVVEIMSKVTEQLVNKLVS